MKDINLSGIAAELERFASERDWGQFHSPKNLAMALSGEAGELLEIFQWLTTAESEQEALSEEQFGFVEEELADILIYAIRIADRLGIDLADGIDRKIATNAKKYPIEEAKGNATKYNKRKK
jgi:dCTP diphosphatase